MFKRSRTRTPVSAPERPVKVLSERDLDGFVEDLCAMATPPAPAVAPAGRR